MTDSVLRYEQQLAGQLADRVQTRLVRANRRITRAYLRATGGLDQPMPITQLGPFAVTVQQALSWGRPNLGRRLARALVRGLSLGLRDTFLALLGRRPHRLPADLRAEAQTLDLRVRRDLADAAALAPHVRNWSDVVTLMAKTHQAVNRVNRVATWAANRAVAAGVQQAADRAGLARLWVPERDACLHCLAYAGQVAQPGGTYRGGLTFYLDPAGRPKPLGLAPVTGPPLHAHCRCRQQPWEGSEDGVGQSDYPQVLQREAQRTVLSGRALASEPAKVRAADALLRHPTLVPMSVRRRAQQAVVAGRFRPPV